MDGAAGHDLLEKAQTLVEASGLPIKIAVEKDSVLLDGWVEVRPMGGLFVVAERRTASATREDPAEPYEFERGAFDCPWEAIEEGISAIVSLHFSTEGLGPAEAGA